MRLTDHIHLVASSEFGLSEGDCHVYAIDAGGSDDPSRLLANAADGGLDPARLGHVLLTHVHRDHTGGLAALRRPADAGRVGRFRTHASAEEARLLEHGTHVELGLDLFGWRTAPCFRQRRWPSVLADGQELATLSRRAAARDRGSRTQSRLHLLLRQDRRTARAVRRRRVVQRRIHRRGQLAGVVARRVPNRAPEARRTRRRTGHPWRLHSTSSSPMRCSTPRSSPSTITMSTLDTLLRRCPASSVGKRFRTYFSADPSPFGAISTRILRISHPVLSRNRRANACCC